MWRESSLEHQIQVFQKWGVALRPSVVLQVVLKWDVTLPRPFSSVLHTLVSLMCHATFLAFYQLKINNWDSDAVK